MKAAFILNLSSPILCIVSVGTVHSAIKDYRWRSNWITYRWWNNIVAPLISRVTRRCISNCSITKQIKNLRNASFKITSARWVKLFCPNFFLLLLFRLTYLKVHGGLKSRSGDVIMRRLRSISTERSRISRAFSR